jgi:dipeptidyl aminopeptidase/acylaminoacyl peptidase
MKGIAKAAVFGVLVVAMSDGSPAQTAINGVSFDSTPLELSSFKPTDRRGITNMDLLTMKDLHGVQISPDGNSVAFVVGEAIYETNSYKTGLFVVGTEAGSVPISLGTAGPPRWDWIGDWISEPPQWSPDSRYIAYRLHTNGSWQVWRWNSDGSRPTQVTHAQNDVQSFEWSSDNQRITFVVKKPVGSNEVRRIEEHGILYDSTIAVSRNKPILEAELSSRPDETETWIHDLASGTERPLPPSEQKQREEWRQRLGSKIADARLWAADEVANIQSPKLSPDGKKVIYRVLNAPAVSGHRLQPLYLKVLDAGPALLITPQFATDYWWSMDSEKIYFGEAPGDGRSIKLFVVDSNGGKPLQLTPHTQGFFDEYSVDSNTTFAACVHSDSTTPAVVTLIDLKTGTFRTLVNINPEFKNLRLSSATRIEWVSKYGEPGHGYLVKPLSYQIGKRYPLIVTTYRSGDYFLRGAGGDEYPIQVFAANDFAVLAWDTGRNPADPEGDFEHAMLEYRWPLASLEAALEVLNNMGIVDPSRRGVTGWSWGTNVIDFAMGHSDLFHAVISSGMGADTPYFYYMAPRYSKQKFVTMGMGGWPEGQSSKYWREFSSALRAERIHAPWLSNAAEDDFMITFQLYTSLEQLGKPIEMFIYANELHTKVQPRHRYEIYERNVDWFKFWFKGEEDADPTKREQYERWHKLKALYKSDLAPSVPH